MPSEIPSMLEDPLKSKLNDKIDDQLTLAEKIERKRMPALKEGFMF
jgi:hypothetical protein